MKIGNHADKCLSFVSCQISPEAKQWQPHTKSPPTVTISRQTGTGAMAIAEELAVFLQASQPKPCHWTVFDKNLVAQVLADHKLPMEVAKYMPEDRVSAIQDAVEELLGLHPPTKELLQLSSDTIMHLAHLGHVILIGHAANVITRDMKNAFHVRLVAPLDMRVAQVMERNQLDSKTAAEFIRKSDLGRKRFLKDHFHADIDDVLQYDLVINTARLPQREVALLIGEAVVYWAKRL
ncbi:MAG: cytidylate kinase-like family protein [Verrucomicrobiota bacterium]